MSQETEWAEGKRWEETSITKDERERLRPWVAVGLVLALGLFLSILGCEHVNTPVCEKYEAEWAKSQDGRAGIFLDMQNVRKLAELVTGLAAGTCRIEAPKAQGMPV